MEENKMTVEELIEKLHRVNQQAIVRLAVGEYFEQIREVITDHAIAPDIKGECYVVLSDGSEYT